MPALNQSLLKGFIQRAITTKRGLKEQYVIRQFGIDCHFFISKSSTGHLFFFFKRKKRPAEVVIDITLRFGIQPAWESRLIEHSAKEVLFNWQIPPFLILQERRRDRILKKISDPKPKNPLILTDGRQNFLLIDFKNPDPDKQQKKRPKANFWFENKQIKEIGENKWQGRPFLLLYESIRSWVADDWVHQASIPVQLNHNNDVHLVLQALAQGFKSTKIELGKTEDVSPIMAPFLEHYDIGDYQADLLLRLDELGDFALVDSRRSYQMGLEMQMSEQQQFYEARIKMHLPDFLVAGELYDAFWDLFLDDDEAEERRQDLCKALRKQRYSEPDEDDLYNFLQAGKTDRASVFRLDRNRRIDINLFFITGFLNGSEVTLIFSGKFEVQSVRPPQIRTRRNDRLQIHYFAADQTGTVDQQFVNYFLRLMGYFNKWMEIL